jgi:transposase
MRYELTDHEWTAIKPMLPASEDDGNVIAGSLLASSLIA